MEATGAGDVGISVCRCLRLPSRFRVKRLNAVAEARNGYFERLFLVSYPVNSATKRLFTFVLERKNIREFDSDGLGAGVGNVNS